VRIGICHAAVKSLLQDGHIGFRRSTSHSVNQTTPIQSEETHGQYALQILADR
jgi:hypothetical protein